MDYLTQGLLSLLGEGHVTMDIATGVLQLQLKKYQGLVVTVGEDKEALRLDFLLFGPSSSYWVASPAFM